MADCRQPSIVWPKRWQKISSLRYPSSLMWTAPEVASANCSAGACSVAPRWVPSVPSEALWQLDRLKLFDITAQLQHSIERFRRGAVCEAGGQVVPPLLKPVQQVRQRLNTNERVGESLLRLMGAVAQLRIERDAGDGSGPETFTRRVQLL